MRVLDQEPPTPLVTSVAVVARALSTAWWCSDDVARRVAAFVDVSPQCALGSALRRDHICLVQRLLHAARARGATIHASAVHDALEAATQRGSGRVVQWLVLHEPALVGRARLMDKAAAGGQLRLLQWLHDHEPLNSNSGAWCSSDAFDGAATNGFLSVLQWLHRHRPAIAAMTRAMDGAASNGHFQVVQWLHANRPEGCTTDAMDQAASVGHLEMVRFLALHRSEGCSSRAIVLAADRGHAEIVRFLYRTYEHQRASAASALAYASWRGHAAVVQFLLRQKHLETMSPPPPPPPPLDPLEEGTEVAE